MRLFLFIGYLFCLTGLFSQAYNPYSNYASLAYGFYSKGFGEFVNHTSSEDFAKRFYNIASNKAELKGPLSLKIEFNVANNLSLGPYIGYEQINLSIVDSFSGVQNKFDFVLKSLSLAARSNLHIKVKSRWFDPFFGIGCGVTIYGYQVKINGEEASNVYNPSLPPAYTEKRFYLKSPLFLSATIGTRLYVTERLGLNIEGGWEKSALLHLGFVYAIKHKVNPEENKKNFKRST